MKRLARAALIAATATISIGAAPVPGGDISVTVTDFRSMKGQVFACLARETDPFPQCNRGDGVRQLVLPTQKADHFTFRNVPAGRYAIALLHDENANRKMDKVLMLPKEGFGFSRDAKVRMGPPSFSDAAFKVDEGGTDQSIRMRYMM